MGRNRVTALIFLSDDVHWSREAADNLAAWVGIKAQVKVWDFQVHNDTPSPTGKGDKKGHLPTW